MTMRGIVINSALAVGLALVAAAPGNAAEVFVQAQPFTKGLPGAASVPMWGFANCSTDGQWSCAEATAPGPEIRVRAGDTTLTVHLRNTLPVHVSFNVPGLAGGGAGQPQFESTSPRRLRSFVLDVPPNGASLTYTFNNVTPGAYLYQSGTYPSFQVPMGLYGAVIVEDGTTPAAVVLLSEIDPRQNACVHEFNYPPASAQCLDGDGQAREPAVVDYHPAWFLVNGRAFDRTTPNASLICAANGLTGQDPLSCPTATEGPQPGTGPVRLYLLNAGLRSHEPAVVGLDMTLTKEDGRPYPTPRKQTQAHVAAGRTIEAEILIPATLGGRDYPIFDRFLDLTNDGKPHGGMLAYLRVGAGSPAATTPGGSGSSSFAFVSTNEDTPLQIHPALASPSVASSPTNGTLEVIPAGGLSPLCQTAGDYCYTPYPNYNGPDSFTYYATGASGLADTVTVSIDVIAQNDLPTATADAYENHIGAGLTVNAALGVLANDGDADGDSLAAKLVKGPVGGSLALDPSGSFTYAGGADQFQYQACEADANQNPTDRCSAPVTVALNIRPVNGFALNVAGPEGPLTAGYRWIVEQDATWHPDPAYKDPLTGGPNPESLGTNLHKSYMPVVAQGCVPGSFPCPPGALVANTTELALETGQHYFVSVLPLDAGTGTGHTLGGTRVPCPDIAPPGASAGCPATDIPPANVWVNRQPLPPAQLSVLVFEDSTPTNAAHDTGERGLGGFQVNLEDAGGRYGQSGGLMVQDKDGQPLYNALADDPNAGCGNVPRTSIVTCPDGRVLVKNLTPGKYSVLVTPPEGGAAHWVQTTTIEGSRVDDAWIKPGEPAYFQEFGPPGVHVFVGFLDSNALNQGRSGPNIVTGRVTNLHMSRPPNQTLYSAGNNEALVHTRAWLGLNSLNGVGANIAAVKAGADGSFSITNVPDGQYQLVVWDEYLDQIIAYRTLTLPGGGVLGDVPVFQWFARLEHNVFLDTNENGQYDADEQGQGLSDQNVNLRFRDGSIYMSYPTDRSGYLPFDIVFPFFHWLVAEVDYTRYKPTGVTVKVDAGGDSSQTGGVLVPQTQAGAECSPGSNCESRTEKGSGVLLEGFQGFIGQTSTMDWGKVPYKPGENGGIAGIVHYASTRAENDPRLGAADNWEPGVPNVRVRLYRELSQGAGLPPKRLFVAETLSDSWDRTPPHDCPLDSTPNRAPDPILSTAPFNTDPQRCYDGLRAFNQVRPAVFDGGYIFTEQCQDPVNHTGCRPLTPGHYVVQVLVPEGYELVKEEDKNVELGDVFASAPVFPLMPTFGPVPAPLPDMATVAAAQAPEPGIAQPPCVGEIHTVPQYLSMFGVSGGAEWGIEAPFAGADRPLCDAKAVVLADRANASADFYFFTSTPIAGHYTGMVLDDTTQEFNPAAPTFGEKWAPPFVPVSIRDYTGRELFRVHADQWGRYNGLVPSTFNANVPNPSGYSPGMWTTCINDPGSASNPDPYYNPGYSNFCYTFQYMPGTTTYLDTPVLPTMAFAAGYGPVDCAFPNETPGIKQVDGDGVGPYVRATSSSTTPAPRLLKIYSQGLTEAPNPAYDGPPDTTAPGQIGGGTQPKTIKRDYGFGTKPGSVTVGGIPLTNLSWSDRMITGNIPLGTPSGQLIVTRGDNGKASINSVTVTVENPVAARPILRVPQQYPTIQAAVDAAAPGALVLVGPGTYEELVIMSKPVRLQGAGAGSTFINAVKQPAEKLQGWRDRIATLFSSGLVDPLPGQPIVGDALEPGPLASEEGAGVTVLGPINGSGGRAVFANNAAGRSRIDGFTITGGDSGGGIFVNGWAHFLEIANNKVTGNAGLLHGGIRVGHPDLQEVGNGPFRYNRRVNIHENAITMNGTIGENGAGGGLALCTGTDGYQVVRNFICGNFTQTDGAGIGHLGLSVAAGAGGEGPATNLIARNWILFNQSFNQGQVRSGGGVFIGGEAAVAGGLSLGSGDVRIDSNLIQGNQAGAGHGAGIRLQQVNGQDLLGPVGRRHRIVITNNMIVNNVAGWSGGGISLLEAVQTEIINNTIVNNDSTSTVGNTFTLGGQGLHNTSTDQPAGISAEPHGPAVRAAMATRPPAAQRSFSNPTLANDLVWHNRSFHYSAEDPQRFAGLVPALQPTTIGACDGPVAAHYWDLGVLGQPEVSPARRLDPSYSVLTSTTGYSPTNLSSLSSAFRAEYCNGARTTRMVPGVTSLVPVPALDEGGNFIDLRFGPISLTGDYHITSGAAPSNMANPLVAPATDYDQQARTSPMDRGADECVPDPANPATCLVPKQ